MSSRQAVTCGIPQGSSLGPVLFLIYINDLPNCSSLLTFRIFADDTNVFASARDLKTLEQLINIKIWCDANKLSINFMIVKSPRKRDLAVNIKIESVDGASYLLERKDRVKLGKSTENALPLLNLLDVLTVNNIYQLHVLKLQYNTILY